MASSGGVVSLRVSLAGDDEIKGRLAALGPAGAQALKQIEQAQSAPNAGMRALNSATKDVAAGLEELGGKAGTAGHVLASIGPAGFAAAAGVGAVIAAGTALVAATKGAMEFGEQLLASSKAAGVSTATLQQYRFAMEQAGGSTAAADSALTKFTTAYGLAGEGQKRYLQFFEKLGFTPDQLKSFGSVDEALDATVDKIAGLGNAADRAAFAKRLGLQEMLPLLAAGADGVARLRAEAVSIGAVMEGSTVKALADAQEQFKKVSDVASIQFKSALVELAPLLVGFVKHVAELAKSLNDLAQQFESIQVKSDGAISSSRQGLANQMRDLIASRPTGYFNDTNRSAPRTGVQNRQRNSDYQTFESLRDEDRQLAAEQTKRANDKPPPQTPALGGFQPDAPKARKGPRGPTADEIAKNSAQAVDQGAQDLDNAKKGELTAQLALTTDIVARAALQEQIADLDEQAAAQGRAKVAAGKLLELQQGKITQAAYDQFVAEEQAAGVARDKTTAARKELAQRNLAVDQIKQTAELEKADYASKLAGLQSQLAITTNVADRRKLALQIFDLEQAEKVAQLQATLSEQQRAGDLVNASITQKALASAIATAPASRQAVSNANPANDWAKMIQQLKADVPTLNNEFADMAAGGVAAFNQGLFDSQGRLNSLGSIANSVFSAMLVSLEQYLLKQAEIGIFGSLLGAVTGGAAGGGGYNAFAGGFASGGLIVGPGGPKSDNMLAAVSPGEVIINAASAHPWLPLLLAINDNKTVPIPHFANGGVVGGASGGAGGFRMGGDTHLHIDRSIYAPGADTAALNRVAAKQDELLKGEPERWVSYLDAAKKIGAVH